MSSAMPAVAASPMPPLPELGGASSQLPVAFWLALAAEVALGLALVWAIAHKPATHTPPHPAEQVRLVRLQKPIQQPKIKFERPSPAPLRNLFHPRPVQLPPPPMALPPPIPLPPSPVAASTPPSPVAASTPPPPPKAKPPVSAGQKLTYLAEVRAAIQGAVRFPSAARLLRMSGRVRVRFKLIDGMVSDARIITPGQIKSFNSNALLAVRDATIPAPPEALAHRAFTLLVWVKFHLHHRSL